MFIRFSCMIELAWQTKKSSALAKLFFSFLEGGHQHNIVLTLVGHLDIPGHCESGLREGLPAVDTDPCDPMPHQVQDTGITAASQCDDDLR